ncbi:MAG: PEP-CTERM sorting domain-containing protein [Acidobacteria bacterium]|nr:PEP-CTERM sorting domain-containing protein [Acidobacteriota bacterium]
MRLNIPFAGILLLAMNAASPGATFTFSTDPFAGTTVLTTPGRQVVGGELFLSFQTASDVFSFSSALFPPGTMVHFANATAAGIPADANFVVLRDTDDDANAGTPFGAGNAANLIAGSVTAQGPGVFVYFNSGLDLPRLVYSADLSDNTADLRILARMLNLTGQTGRDALATFSEGNFEIVAASVPEPSSLGLAGAALALIASLGRLRRQNVRGF